MTDEELIKLWKEDIKSHESYPKDELLLYFLKQYNEREPIERKRVDEILERLLRFDERYH